MLADTPLQDRHLGHLLAQPLVGIPVQAGVLDGDGDLAGHRLQEANSRSVKWR